MLKLFHAKNVFRKKLSNPGGECFTPRAKETGKISNIFKKFKIQIQAMQKNL